MFSLVPKEDPAQILRIRRLLMAGVGYLVWSGLAALFLFRGSFSVSSHIAIIYLAFILATQFIFYCIFRFGLNKIFRDPSLTMPQMFVGTLIASGLFYFVEEARGGMLLLYMVIFIFGIFRLKILQFLFQAILAIICYGSIVLLLYLRCREHVNIEKEFTNMIIVSAALIWYSVIGSYINRLRNDLRRAKKRIEKLAIYDDLTKVYNRRQMFDILQRKKEVADRNGSHFAVCILDLDHFKNINDIYGHLTGDHVLEKLASVVASQLANSDSIARYGGEEFVLILSRKEIEKALSCAEKVRKSIEEIRSQEIGDDIRITVSIGLTMYRNGEPIDETIARADTLLYRAKKRGRNRVECDEFKSDDLIFDERKCDFQDNRSEVL